jgi:tetratricopeptide (TPR) repeat protein
MTAINNMTVLFKAQDKIEEAEPLLRESLELRRRVFGKDNPRTIVALVNMAACLRMLKRLDEAEPFLLDAMRVARTLDEDNYERLNVVLHMGYLREAQGELDEAETHFREVIRGRRKVFGDTHSYTIAEKSTLGEVLVKQAADPSMAVEARLEKLREAEPLLVEWGDWLLRHNDQVSEENRSKWVREALERIVSLYDAWDVLSPEAGKAEQAARWRAELDELPPS